MDDYRTTKIPLSYLRIELVPIRIYGRIENIQISLVLDNCIRYQQSPGNGKAILHLGQIRISQSRWRIRRNLPRCLFHVLLIVDGGRGLLAVPMRD